MWYKISGVLLLFLFFFTWLPSHHDVADEKGRFYFEKRGEAIWEVPTDRKVMALTFDDGPSPKSTPGILDVLKKYNANATFFVTGENVKKYPELVRREVREGNEVGNHTYTHPSFRGASREQILKQIEKTEQAIQEVIHQTPTLFRPPEGYYNETIINAAREKGYTVVMWSWDQDTMDWSRPGVGSIVQKVVTHASNGDIVIFHDYVPGRTQTIAALKEILPELKEEGYEFVTVSEMLELRKEDQWLKKELGPQEKEKGRKFNG
ncbi:MAG TPA: polysaccharide deacetylase family protein [Bacillales bacterium]|nr:polysaccharide deacetylase family protein [Bacillales bacterium]